MFATVLSEGTVAESGDPVQLMRRDGSLFKAYIDQNLHINAENAAASAAMAGEADDENDD